MARDDSPLRDRVLFVEGAPRSGTTLLGSLLAVHPQIAAAISESQLWANGVDALFDNHAGGAGRYQSFLSNYVSHEQLVDLVRGLADGVLVAMRERVKPDADWVAEKSPAPPERAAEVLARKREVYPDGRYLHVVRDPDEVVRSLAGAPWNPLDRAGSERWREQGVAAIRAAFADSDRYLEIDYAELAADPAATVAGLLDWIGLDRGPEVIARVEAMARERISSFSPAAPGSEPVAKPANGRSRPARAARRIAGALRGAAPPSDRDDLASRLVAALRDGDAAAVAALTADQVALVLRSGGGDLRADGERAREQLLRLGRALFRAESIAEEWTVAAAPPSSVLLVESLRGDGTRTDACIAVSERDGEIAAVGVICAGPPEGRVPAPWGDAAGAPR